MVKLTFAGSATEEFRSKSLFGNSAKIGDKTAWVMVEEGPDRWRVSWVLEKEVELVNEQYRLEPIKNTHIMRLWKK